MTTAISLVSSVLSASQSRQQGLAEQRSYQAQARAEENRAQQESLAKQIERKRALVKALAAQNVGAAAQGRTISSISALQSEDIRREKYDQDMLKMGGQVDTSGLKTAGRQAVIRGNTQATSSLLSGIANVSKLQ